MIRAMIVAGALAVAATAANAAEPAACYDAAVIATLVDHANDRLLDGTPVPPDRILPRLETDLLVHNWSQVAGPTLPEAFWARAVLTGTVDPNVDFLVYLKNQPDGVPAIVGYRYAPPFYRPTLLTDYPAC